MEHLVYLVHRKCAETTVIICQTSERSTKATLVAVHMLGYPGSTAVVRPWSHLVLVDHMLGVAAAASRNFGTWVLKLLVKLHVLHHLVLEFSLLLEIHEEEVWLIVLLHFCLHLEVVLVE